MCDLKRKNIEIKWGEMFCMCGFDEVTKICLCVGGDYHIGFIVTKKSKR